MDEKVWNQKEKNVYLQFVVYVFVIKVVKIYWPDYEFECQFWIFLVHGVAHTKDGWSFVIGKTFCFLLQGLVTFYKLPKTSKCCSPLNWKKIEWDLHLYCFFNTKDYPCLMKRWCVLWVASCLKKRACGTHSLIGTIKRLRIVSMEKLLDAH